MEHLEEKVAHLYIGSIVVLLVFGIIIGTVSTIFRNTETKVNDRNATVVRIPTYE